MSVILMDNTLTKFTIFSTSKSLNEICKSENIQFFSKWENCFTDLYVFILKLKWDLKQLGQIGFTCLYASKHCNSGTDFCIANRCV